jgi:hypothetical protein
MLTRSCVHYVLVSSNVDPLKGSTSKGKTKTPGRDAVWRDGIFGPLFWKECPCARKKAAPDWKFPPNDWLRRNETSARESHKQATIL